MDSGLIIYIWETYGIPGILLLVVAVGLWQLRKSIRQLKKTLHDRIDDKAGRITDLESSISNFHESCHIPRGSMKEVKEEIKELKEKDRQIEVDLVGIRGTLDHNNLMITQLHNHFLEKGLKGDK